MASCNSKKLRVRLRFDIAPPSCPSCKCFMFLIDRDAARCVSDVEHTIANKFGFSSSRYLVLSINDFVLLSSDDVEVIRDDDDIQVKIDHALKDDEQITNADAPIAVAVKTKSKKRICEDSNERPSKKVKKIEQTKLNKSSKVVEQRKKVVRKKKPKILKKTGRTPQSAKSRPSKLKTPSVQSSDSSSSSDSDELVKPRIQIKRQTQASSTSSSDSSDEKTKNIFKTNTSKPAAKSNLRLSVLKTKPKTQSLPNKNTSSSSEEDTSSSDSDDGPNAKPQPPKPTLTKSNNVVAKQVKAATTDSSSDSDSEPNTKSVPAGTSNLSSGTVSRLNPKTQPPISSSSDDDSTSDSGNEPNIATHKSPISVPLKPSGVVAKPEETSSSDDDSDSEGGEKVLQSCKNEADNKVLTSQKALLNNSWANRDKSIAMRAYPNYHNKSVVLTCTDNVNDKEIAMETETKPVDAIAKPLVNDYSTLMSLSWPPRVKDKIAYQALEMSPIDYTPNVSEYKEAEVISVSNDKQITVNILYQEKAPANLEVPGRFELVYDEEEQNEDQSEDDTITLDWTSLMNVKLIQ
ncbi:uncharacterized protein LOC100185855 [Ciona intestinalis]